MCRGISTPTPAIPTPTSFQQILASSARGNRPAARSVIGHRYPITFYFNQAVNKASVESALSGLPAGTFTWNDDATLVFTPTQSYQPNSTLKHHRREFHSVRKRIWTRRTHRAFISSCRSLARDEFSATGGAEDVNVNAAIAVSFNQPVVALGADVFRPAFRF